MKLLWTLFAYASLGFVALYLYRLDYLSLPEILRPGALATSGVSLLLGFVLETIGWQRMLASGGARLSTGDAVAASGRSVLGKYIPGKLWMIVGRAAFAARVLARPLSHLSLLTLNAQVLALWAALALGLPGLVALGGLREWGPVWLASFGVFSILLFSRVVHDGIDRWLTERGRGLGERLPHVDPGTGARVAPWLFGCWVAWGAGFAAFGYATVPGDVMSESVPGALTLGAAFPLASALGMAAIFVPGGMGVREGVLAGLLVLDGLDVGWATRLAVTSRLWFLAGELAWFGIGHLAGRTPPND